MVTVSLSIFGGLVVLVLLGLLVSGKFRSKKPPEQIEGSEEHTALLLAEKEVEALLSEGEAQPDILPFNMLDRKFRHRRDNEVIWTAKDNFKTDIEGHLFIDPAGFIYNRKIENYPKIVVHSGTILVEMPSYASFAVQDDIPEEFIKADVVTVVPKKKPVYYYPC
jgi:hypothetical protein